MERKVLDLITTKYASERVNAELEIEKIIANKAFDSDMDIDTFTNSVMSKIHKLREINADSQMWENILAQLLTQSPEKE